MNIYVKSNYSLLSSLISIDDLISFALKNNLKSLCLCDDNMLGVMEFYTKCLKNKIKPIIGLDIKVTDKDHTFSVVLLAKNYSGYKEMVPFTAKDKIELNDLSFKNVIIIIPYNEFDINYDNLSSYIYYGYSNDIEKKKLKDKNKVYFKKVLYLDKDDYSYLKYLYLIRDSKTINDNYDFDDLDNFYDLSINDKNIDTIISECNLKIKSENDLLPIYENNLDNNDLLKNMALEGLKKRVIDISDSYLKRLNYELDVISKMGYSDYFLIVADFIKYAKEKGILVGPGRGTAGSSLVAYSLFITEIDPLKYDLYFERFLNEERVTMPDIDTDFPDIYRDEVIQYVKDKYGNNKVSGIVTISRMSSKMVIRDLGRVLEIEPRFIDSLSYELSYNTSLKEAYSKRRRFKDIVMSRDKLQLLYKLALRLENFPRQLGTHAAGIIISRKELDKVIPLIKNDNLYLASYTMEYLEMLGLLKMDFLGIKNLTIIMNVLKEIGKDNNYFNNIPLDDSKTYKLFSDGLTNGIFQFESEGMKKFLREMRPNSFSDLISAIAIFRPGPAKEIPEYLKRRREKKEIVYSDLRLKKILDETNGILIYQEQIMKIAHEVAGFSLGEADILRRAISKKNESLMISEKEKFIEGCLKGGLEREKGEEIFNLILKFASYGFNKSHSVAYSLVAYKMAYLKVHFPHAFYASLLTSFEGDSVKEKKYLEEAKMAGLKVLKPLINKSVDCFKAEEGAIRLPLSSIKNIGGVVINDLKKIERNFIDIYEAFIKLYGLGLRENQFANLIGGEAFSLFHFNIRTLMENLKPLLNYADLVNQLDVTMVEKPQIVEYPEYSSNILVTEEHDLFGFYIRLHPVSLYNNKYKVIKVVDLKKYEKRLVDILVMVDNKKEIYTKKHDKMAFLDASDETGKIDIVIFPDIYKEVIINKDNIILLRGEVEKRNNSLQIVASKVKVLN